ncbi:uncharacterized protein PHACADRAFT_189553 [Phanerochaete carnosa HHB-10118-sp]|uniref:Nephrocystin 3-like N-terminal domain-containing protein n=1 Tax=Phanerochaete carnosa (strain HHB-10118-sp) TaxID=650164 RepID=K5VBX9_PHACS|nr:uncharacterized protein PHACADRAFT_189553 [Phanerochaete carnosa HHB-10118-sp]EKM60421.1 hypothetical protein PHACADRAFT_189553 [Phanerochaete carnosa HHB-10118-sp]
MTLLQPQAVRENKEVRSAFLAQVAQLVTVIVRAKAKAEDVVADHDGDEREKQKLAESIKRSDQLKERTQGLLSSIDELRRRAAGLKGGAGFCGFLKGFVHVSRNQTILSEMKEEITRALKLFEIRGSISVESILDEVARVTKGIQHEMREALRQLQEAGSILHASAGYRSVDELKSGFMEGTREKLFAELDGWWAGRFPEGKPKRFYFLSGRAGLGKSTISHQICVLFSAAEQLSLKLGASFFFVRSGGDLEDARLFFPTLARQLALSQPTLRPHIISAAREYLKYGDQQQMQHAFEGLLCKALVAAPASDQPPTLLVIDGIDECKDTGRTLVPELLLSLPRLVREIPWLYIFAASRPEFHVLSVLAHPDSADIVHYRSLDDTLEDWAGDVERYLVGTVPKMPSYAGFLREHPDALNRLISRAAGVFIFARISVNFLDSYPDYLEEQFELLFSDGGAGL